MSFPFKGFSSYEFATNDIPYHFLLTFFPLGFKGVLMEYQHIYVITIISPIFPKGLRSFSHDIYIHTSPKFSHRDLQGVFRLITRPQEGQIDQGGVL